MDASVIKLVVGVLGFVALACVVGLVVTSCMHKEPPAALVSLAATSIGAVAGILAVQRESKP